MKRPAGSSIRIPQREETAYHEAGHAFIAFHSRAPFTEVSILQDQKHQSLGHVLNPWWLMDEDDQLRMTVNCPSCGEQLSRRDLADALFRDYELRDPDDTVLHYLRFLYAGCESVRIRRKTQGRSIGCSDDIEKAQSIAAERLRYYNAEELNALHHHARLSARALLRQNWSAVQRLATALLERKRVTGEEARAILKAG